MRTGSRLEMGRRVERGIKIAGEWRSVVMCRYDHTEAETLNQRTHQFRVMPPMRRIRISARVQTPAAAASPFLIMIATESRPRTPYPRPDRPPARSPQVRSGETLHHARALLEAGPEDAVRVLEHAVLQTHHDELAALEPRLDQAADVLRM